MKKFKFRATRDFHDIEVDGMRTTGEYFIVESEERVYQLLNKPEEEKVVELYEVKHD